MNTTGKSSFVILFCFQTCTEKTLTFRYYRCKDLGIYGQTESYKKNVLNATCNYSCFQCQTKHKLFPFLGRQIHASLAEKLLLILVRFLVFLFLVQKYSFYEICFKEIKFAGSSQQN